MSERNGIAQRTFHFTLSVFKLYITIELICFLFVFDDKKELK